MFQKSFYSVLFLLLSVNVFSQLTLEQMGNIRVAANDFFRGGSNPADDPIEEIPPLQMLLVNQVITSGNNSGSWENVVYSDTNPNDGSEDTDDTNWDPIQHLENLKLLAEVYAWGEDVNTYTNEVIGERIITGLQYWYWYGTQNTENCGGNTANCATTTPCATNWWWNTIGKLRELQEIAIMVYPLLSDDTSPPTVPGTTTTLLDAIIADFPDDVMDCNGLDNYTGANLTEVAVNLIIHGLLRNDTDGADLAESGANELKNAVTVDEEEGIQFDNSFHQHGSLLYTGGYGHEFIEQHCLWARLLMNTSVEYNAAQRLALYKCVLNGYRLMLVGYTTDYSTAGRYIARPYPANPKDHPVSSKFINRLEQVVVAKGEQTILSPEIPDIKIALCDMTDDDESAAGRQDVSGNKYFWQSDYIIHHAENYVASIKMCSNRTIGTESVDHENKLGFWLPYGCTLIYSQGDEYTDIFPIWDWRKIPGVTCADFEEPFDNMNGSTLESTQNEAFVGSAGNNDYSTTTMVLNKPYSNGTVQAKKAWFNFGDEIIALGAGISGGTNAIVTTINQTHLVGNVSHANAPNGTAQTISAGVLDPSTPTLTNWIEHNGTAYIFPNNEDIYVSTESKDEFWTRIGTKSGSESGNIFKAWINHTASSSSSYYYIIAPGQNAATYAGSNPVTLLKNTALIQAVRKVETDGDVLAGIVYYPGSEGLPVVNKEVEITPNIKLYTNKPCALLYDGNIGQVCISSPIRDETDLVLTVKENVIGGEVMESITFDLPEGDNAGTSICMDIFDITRGNVTNHCGGGIPGIEIFDHEYSSIYWNPNTATLLSITNLGGNYSIARRTTENFTIDPKKDIDFLNGVTIEDVLLLQDHILAAPGSVLDSPYKKIAADVNFDGETTWDAWQLNQLLIGNGYFINTDSWEFVEADHQFPLLGNPSLFVPVPPNYPIWPFPQTIDITSPSNNNNFLGMKMGDLNCDALNGFGKPCEDEVKILIEDKVLTTNELFTVTLHVENFTNIRTYQFGLDFRSDKIQYQGIQQGNLTKGASIENFALSAVNNGSIKNIWHQNDATVPTYTVRDTSLSDGASLFKVQFKALENITSLYGLLKLSDETFLAKAWSGEDDCFHPIRLELMPVGWSSGRSDDHEDENITNKVRVHPNPTTGALSFEISTDIAAENTIQIYNPTGQQVLRQSVYLEKGNNTVLMEDISNWQDGLYFYTITDASGAMSNGKFVKQ